MGRIGPNATPGTGEQVAYLATAPNTDPEGREQPVGYWFDGRKWHCGKDYLDTEIGDVCTLQRVIAVSSWCQTKDPEECTPQLVFSYGRYDGPIRLKPRRDLDLTDRFIERYEPPRPTQRRP